MKKITIDQVNVATKLKRKNIGWMGVECDQDLRVVVDNGDTIHAFRNAACTNIVGLNPMKSQLDRILNYTPRSRRLIDR